MSSSIDFNIPIVSINSNQLNISLHKLIAIDYTLSHTTQFPSMWDLSPKCYYPCTHGNRMTNKVK